METITHEQTTKITSTDTARVKWMTGGVEMMKFGQYGFPKPHLFKVNGASRLVWGSKHNHNVELAQIQSISRGMGTKRFRRHKKKFPHLEQFAISIVYFNRDTWPAKLKTLDVAFVFPVDVLSGGDNGKAEFEHLMAALEQMAGDMAMTCEDLEAKLIKPQVVPNERVAGGGGGGVGSGGPGGNARSSPRFGKSLHGPVTSPFVNKHVTVTGTSRDDLNGRLGLATAFDSKAGRYVVMMDDEREFKLKPENLTLGIRTRSGSDVRKLSAAAESRSVHAQGAEPGVTGRRDKSSAAAAPAGAEGRNGADARRVSWAGENGDGLLVEAANEDKAHCWQGWLKVSRRDLLEHNPTPFRTRYVVVTATSMIQWKGPTETMAEMYHGDGHDMTADELEGAGFFPRKEIFFDKVKTVQMSKMHQTDFAIVTTSTVVWCCKSVDNATALVELMQTFTADQANTSEASNRVSVILNEDVGDHGASLPLFESVVADQTQRPSTKAQRELFDDARVEDHSDDGLTRDSRPRPPCVAAPAPPKPFSYMVDQPVGLKNASSFRMGSRPGSTKSLSSGGSMHSMSFYSKSTRARPELRNKRQSVVYSQNFGRDKPADDANPAAAAAEAPEEGGGEEEDGEKDQQEEDEEQSGEEEPGWRSSRVDPSYRHSIDTADSSLLERCGSVYYVSDNSESSDESDQDEIVGRTVSAWHGPGQVEGGDEYDHSHVEHVDRSDSEAEEAADDDGLLAESGHLAPGPVNCNSRKLSPEKLKALMEEQGVPDQIGEDRHDALSKKMSRLQLQELMASGAIDNLQEVVVDQTQTREYERADSHGKTRAGSVANAPHWLRVKLLKITNIAEPASFLHAERDPFVNFHLEKKGSLGPVQQSRKILDECNPVWCPPQAFEWGLTLKNGGATDYVVAEVFDWNRWFDEDQPLGFVRIPLAPFYNQGYMQHVQHLLDAGTGRTSATAIHLEVYLMDKDKFDSIVYQKLYEQERWTFSTGWEGGVENLHEGECAYVSADGTRMSNSFEEAAPPLPPGYQVYGQDWHLFQAAGADDIEGWQYAHCFTSQIWCSVPTQFSFVRRRVWQREVHGTHTSEDTGSQDI